MTAASAAPSPASSNTLVPPERKSLRIAMVVPPYFDVPPKAYGGVEAVVADLVDALVERGHEVTLLGAGVHGTRAAEFIPLWDEIQAARLGDPFPEVLHALKVRRALERLTATRGLDLVHDHTFAGPLNLPVYRALGLPMVVTVHGPVDGDPHMYYSELGEDAALVAISDRQRALAPGLNWVGRVHNALRVADFPFQPEKEDYALFLGRYTPEKAPHLALAAAHACDMRLVLAGKCAEPPEIRYFDDQVAPLLTERDTVFGMADAAAKKKLLAGARCLLFPVQWEEPFGMVMIEAMACGTPVVALRGGAVSEVLVDGVTGRICDDPDELPAAIKEVRDYDPQACRDHVLEHFGTDTLGRGYEEVYRKVVATRPTRTGRITVHQPPTTPPTRTAGAGPGRATPAPARTAGPTPSRAPSPAGTSAAGGPGHAPTTVPARTTPARRAGTPPRKRGQRSVAGANPARRTPDPASAPVPAGNSDLTGTPNGLPYIPLGSIEAPIGGALTPYGPARTPGGPAIAADPVASPRHPNDVVSSDVPNKISRTGSGTIGGTRAPRIGSGSLDDTRPPTFPDTVIESGLPALGSIAAIPDSGEAVERTAGTAAHPGTSGGERTRTRRAVARSAAKRGRGVKRVDKATGSASNPETGSAPESGRDAPTGGSA